MRARRASFAPLVGVHQLLEVVEVQHSFAGFSLAADALRAEKERLGLDLTVAARFSRVPAPQLVLVLGSRRAFRTREAYEVVGDRLRAAARFRESKAAGKPSRRPGGWR